MQLKPLAKQLYRLLTASTERRSRYAVFLSLVFFVYGTMFLGGVSIGAGTHVSGKPLSNVLTEINAAQFELWMSFAKESVLGKAGFGLLYPVIGLLFVTIELGVQLGYTVPKLGYVVGGLNLLWPAFGLGLIALQLIHFAELYRE